jgi:lipopolysaccharide transport system permease protein
MTTILETFRYAILGQGSFSVAALVQATIITICIFFAGLVLFSKVERNFVDTI